MQAENEYEEGIPHEIFKSLYTLPSKSVKLIFCLYATSIFAQKGIDNSFKINIIYLPEMIVFVCPV